MIGIEASVAMGTIAGNAAKELMVISGVTKAELPRVQEYLQKDCIKVFNASKPIKLYIRIEAYYKQDKVIVEFKYTHTNITLIKKNDEIIYEVDDADNKSNLVDEIISKFSIKEIYKIASQLDTSKISDMLDKIVKDNSNSSCSIKIANSVYTAFNAAMLGNTVTPRDGIVGDDVEDTIKNIAILATGKGMNETDDAILGVMTGRLAEICK